MDTKENFEPYRDESNPMFWRIRGTKGGKVPKSLSGEFTKKVLADFAIRQYVLYEKYDAEKKPYSSRELQKARTKKCPEATAKSTKTKRQSEE